MHQLDKVYLCTYLDFHQIGKTFYQGRHYNRIHFFDYHSLGFLKIKASGKRFHHNLYEMKNLAF